MTHARRACAVLLVLCLGLLTACSGRGAERSGPQDPPAPTGAGTASVEVEQETVSGDAPQEAEQVTEVGTPGASLPDGVVTALLVGNDSRDDDVTGLSDVIVLVQLSADREHLTLVSVARDSLVDIPGHGADKVNAAYARGGAPLLRRTVSDLLGGLEIDLVAQADFAVFTELTRALDGFWVVNEHASTVGRTEFQEGRIHLDESNALDYVRQRDTLPLGDLDRTQRHRAALAGMMDRLVEVREQEPARLLELLPLMAQHVEVEGNLRLEQLMSMVDVGAELGPEGVTSLMVPVSRFGTSPAGASVNVLDEVRTRELAEGLREGDVSEYVERYGTSYAPTGG